MLQASKEKKNKFGKKMLQKNIVVFSAKPPLMLLYTSSTKQIGKTKNSFSHLPTSEDCTALHGYLKPYQKTAEIKLE